MNDPATPKHVSKPLAITAILVIVGGIVVQFDLCAPGSGTSPVPSVVDVQKVPNGVMAQARAEEAKAAAAAAAAATQRPAQRPEPPAAPRRWYHGGTLHRASAVEWKAASYENKLATAGDMLAKLWSSGKLKPHITKGITSVDDLAPLAAQLVVGIDKSYSGDTPTNGLPDVPTTAILLLTMMKWT